MKKRIFINYAREDKGFADKLYTDLQLAGEAPWMDSMDLILGQPWDATIRKAISDSSYFITLLSSRSVGKKGYVQKEIRHALDIAEEYPEDQIWIMPLRIDECEPSFEGLKRLHRIDLFSSYEKALKEILRAVKYESEEKPALVKIDIRKQAGTISRWLDRGFGFIKQDEDEKDIFFHSKELLGVQFNDLRIGDHVLFSMAESPKGPVAVDVERL
jgi:cold shock CspA family protein